MGELALEHVEAQLAWSRRIVLGSDEFEVRLWSMKRRINQAQAMRSTCTPLRVTHVLPVRSSEMVFTSMSFAFSSLVPSASFFSSSVSNPSTISRPLAPKKSIALSSECRCLRRARLALVSGFLSAEVAGTDSNHGAERAQLLRDLGIVQVARRIEQGPHLLIREAIDQAGLADRAFAAALLDLAQQPLEILQRLFTCR